MEGVTPIRLNYFGIGNCLGIFLTVSMVRPVWEFTRIGKIEGHSNLRAGDGKAGKPPEAPHVGSIEPQPNGPGPWGGLDPVFGLTSRIFRFCEAEVAKAGA